MATKEFDILALDGSNFPTWAMDVKTNVPKGNKQTRKSSGKGKNKRSKKQHGTDKKGKCISKQKNDNSNKTTCFRYGCYNHIAKKCRTPRHLVELYMKSMGPSDNNKKYEANFTSQVLETGAMDPIPHGAGPSNTKTPPNEDDGSMDIDDMLIEYASQDIYGD
uniref:CCHC-type domain-containing protein n=1 Tax=Oryza brachyantha TaxID=4533 RepID=J3NAG2_ORYBR